MIVGLHGQLDARRAAWQHLRTHHGFTTLAFRKAARSMLLALPGLAPFRFQDRFQDQVIPAMGMAPAQMVEALVDWGNGLPTNLWIAALRAELARVNSSQRVVVTDVFREDEAQFVRSRGGLLISLCADQGTISNAVSVPASGPSKDWLSMMDAAIGLEHACT